MKKMVFVIIVVLILIVGCSKQQQKDISIGPSLAINNKEVMGIAWYESSSETMHEFDIISPEYIWPVTADKIVISMGYEDGWDASNHGLYLVNFNSLSDGRYTVSKGFFLPPGEVNAHSVVYHWDDLNFKYSNVDSQEKQSFHIIFTPRPGIIYFVDSGDKMIQEWGEK